MKTLERLENRVWYRLLKVAYVVCFAFVVMFVSLGVYISSWRDVEWCVERNDETPVVRTDVDSTDRVWTWTEVFDQDDWAAYRSMLRDWISQEEAVKGIIEHKSASLIKEGFDQTDFADLRELQRKGVSYDKAVESIRSYKAANYVKTSPEDNNVLCKISDLAGPAVTPVVVTILSCLWVLAIFEFWRRIFYYIVLGRFYPSIK